MDYTIEELEDMTPWQRHQVVSEDPNLSLDVLNFLSEDKMEDIRCGVVSHPNVDIKILDKLSGDVSEYVRRDVARNSLATEDILDRLSGDSDLAVRYYVANNPKSSVKVLCKLYDKERVGRNMGILDALWSNEKSPDWLKASVYTIMSNISPLSV
jgi:hypothetical protein